MERIWIGFALISVFVIGFIHLKIRMRELSKKLSFLWEFRDKFAQLSNQLDFSYGNMGSATNLDHNLYDWLSRKSVKAQRLVGYHGIGNVIGPYQLWKATNYQFIINNIPKIRDGSVHHQEVTMVDDCLTRGIGDYEEDERELINELRNPIKWFQHGVRLVISFPIRLLKWFDIIPEYLFLSLTRNWVFKLFSGLVSLIGLLGAIVGLITGWNGFLVIVSGWIK